MNKTREDSRRQVHHTEQDTNTVKIQGPVRATVKFLGVQESEMYQNIPSKVKDNLLTDPVGESRCSSRILRQGQAIHSRQAYTFGKTTRAVLLGPSRDSLQLPIMSWGLSDPPSHRVGWAQQQYHVSWKWCTWDQAAWIQTPRSPITGAQASLPQLTPMPCWVSFRSAAGRGRRPSWLYR